MPISPSYTWEETEQALEVVVHLPGASRAKSDVFATECMLKVNSSPYLLLIDLHADVDDALSAATLTADGVKFKLFKRVPGLWGRLTREASSKEELQARRNASIDRAHARLEEARLARLERKQKTERVAIDRQIEIERKKRLEIDRRKGEELDIERGGIQAWQQELQQQQQKQQLQQQQGNESDYESEEEEPAGSTRQQNELPPMPDHEHYYGKGWRPSSRPKQVSQDLSDQGAAAGPAQGSASAKTDDDAEEEEEEERGRQQQRKAQRSMQPDTWADVQQASSRAEDGGSGGDASLPSAPQALPEAVFKPLPPPRMRLEPVRVEFTKLETPHLPARAQREEELRTYKAKLVDDKLLADSQDVADRQPVFLKDKGDALYKQGNYRGALNAYSRAIELDDAIPLIWANRGACHLALGSHEAAMGDCTRALDLLLMRQDRYESGNMDVPDMAAYKKQLLRVRVRRGQALSQMGRLAQALQDYEQAMRLDPDNASLAADVDELRAALGPADIQALKQRGAARFQAGDHVGAVEAWGLLLSLPHDAVPTSEQQAALSNRAAALLVLGRFAEGEADCFRALALALAALHSQASQQQQQQQQQQQAQQQGQQHQEQAQQLQEQMEPLCQEQQQQQQHQEQEQQPQEQMQPQQPDQQPYQQQSLPSPQPQQLSVDTCTFTLHPPTLPLGDPVQLASAARAAATATQGELAHTAASVEDAEAALHAYAHTLVAALQHWHPASQQHAQQQQGHSGQQGHLEQQGHSEQQGLLQQQQQQQQQEGQQGMQCAGSAAAAVKALVSPLARLLARRGALRGHMRLYSSALRDCNLAAQLYAAMKEPEKAKQLEADACTLSRLMDEHKTSAYHAQQSLDECSEV